MDIGSETPGESEAAGWVVLAKLLRPQGRKGELLAELLTDFPERFAQRPRVFLAADGFDGAAEEEARSVEVASHWLPVGKNAGRIVLRFVGVDSIQEAERVAGLDVMVPVEERLALEEGAAYVSDLVGCVVFDGEVEVGAVDGVQFPATADGGRLHDAAPLLIVRGEDGGEILIPFANDFVVKIDLEAKQIWMRLPEGLVDVNR